LCSFLRPPTLPRLTFSCLVPRDKLAGLWALCGSLLLCFSVDTYGLFSPLSVLFCAVVCPRWSEFVDSSCLFFFPYSLTLGFPSSLLRYNPCTRLSFLQLLILFLSVLAFLRRVERQWVFQALLPRPLHFAISHRRKRSFLLW